MGTLKVLLKNSAGTSTLIWQMTGEQGDKWIQASVEIQRDSQYKVWRLTINVLTNRTIMSVIMKMFNS